MKPKTDEEWKGLLREALLLVPYKTRQRSRRWEQLREVAGAPRGARAPVQPDYPPGPTHSGGTISWEEHEEAWLGYQRKYPSSAVSQGPVRITERGGFSYFELVEQLGYEPRTFREDS